MRRVIVWEVKVITRPPEREGVLVAGIITTHTVRLVSEARPTDEQVLALFADGRAEILGKPREAGSAFLVE